MLVPRTNVKGFMYLTQSPLKHPEPTETPKFNGADMLLFMNIAEMHVFYFLHLNRDLVTMSSISPLCIVKGN
jgi:hypothetical protein